VTGGFWWFSCALWPKLRTPWWLMIDDDDWWLIDEHEDDDDDDDDDDAWLTFHDSQWMKSSSSTLRWFLWMFSLKWQASQNDARPKITCSLLSFTSWTIATELGMNRHTIMNFPTKNGHRLRVNPPVLDTPKSYRWVYIYIYLFI